MKFWRRHKHQWRVDKAVVQRLIDGSASTFLIVQCETCAKVRKERIAKLEMSGDQVNNYTMAHYSQVTNYSTPNWSTAKEIYR